MRTALGTAFSDAIKANDALAVRTYFRVTKLDHPVENFSQDAPADLLWKVITARFPELKKENRSFEEGWDDLCAETC